MKARHQIFALLTATAAAMPLHAQSLADLPATLSLPRDASRVEYQPLQYNEIINPMTGEPLNEFDVILTVKDGEYQYSTADELLAVLNNKEQRLNQLGESLRNGVADLVLDKLPNPDITIRGLTADTGISLNKLVENFQEGEEQCDSINVSMLGNNPATGKPYRLDDKIDFLANYSLAVKDFVPKMNEQQKLFCALGYSLLAEVGGQDVVASILAKRDELMKKFAIPADHPLYSMVGWVQAANVQEITDRINQVKSALENPTPEKIYLLAQANKDILPAELQLPEIPRIEQPQLKKRVDLKLLKEYRWHGFQEGKRDLFQAYANAYAELRGGRLEEAEGAPANNFALQGEAVGGIFIFNNDVPLVKGILDAQIDPNNGFARLEYCILSSCTSQQKGIENFALREGDPNLFNKNWQVQHAMQTSIGPVPVVLRAGAGLNSRAGWEVGLTLMNAYGQAEASAQGYAFGEAAVGIQDFIEAGAGGKVNVIDDTLTLQAEAEIKLKGNGYPVITGSLTGDNRLQALNGEIYGYALVDVTGPLGPLADEIVKSLEQLGESAQAVINQLSNISDAAKNLSKKWDDARKALSKTWKKARKRLGFAAPTMAGRPFGLTIDGLKVRYQETIFTWAGINKNQRFLNYKLMVGPDGQRFEGDVASYQPQDLAIFEENLNLQAYEEALVKKKAEIKERETAILRDIETFVNGQESRSLDAVFGNIQSKFDAIQKERNSILSAAVGS
jgi:hypothetical protein